MQCIYIHTIHLSQNLLPKKKLNTVRETQTYIVQLHFLAFLREFAEQTCAFKPISSRRENVCGFFFGRLLRFQSVPDYRSVNSLSPVSLLKEKSKLKLASLIANQIIHNKKIICFHFDCLRIVDSANTNVPLSKTKDWCWEIRHFGRRTFENSQE